MSRLQGSDTDSILEIYMGSSLKPFFIRVPYYIGDRKRDPNLENNPHGWPQGFTGGKVGLKGSEALVFRV